MKKTVLIALCVILFWLTTNDDHTLAIADTKQITLAVGLSLPPYIIAEQNIGIEFDIVREALAYKGYVFKPKYVPQGRRIIEFTSGKVDGTLLIQEDQSIQAFFSDIYIVYQNIAVSLTKNNFVINSIPDLKNRSIMAFQFANRLLGDEFGHMANANAQYQEIPNQMLQINLLYAGRIDTIVLDKNIFYYYRKQNQTVDKTLPITIHNIFPPTPYKIAFKEQKVRDDFNLGLQHLRSENRYEKIIRSYIEEKP